MIVGRLMKRERNHLWQMSITERARAALYFREQAWRIIYLLAGIPNSFGQGVMAFFTYLIIRSSAALWSAGFAATAPSSIGIALCSFSNPLMGCCIKTFDYYTHILYIDVLTRRED